MTATRIPGAMSLPSSVRIASVVVLFALFAVPAATAAPEPLPECPDGIDEGTCAGYEHYRYCAHQKPPFLGDSWSCLPNPMPW